MQYDAVCKNGMPPIVRGKYRPCEWEGVQPFLVQPCLYTRNASAARREACPPAVLARISALNGGGEVRRGVKND